MIRYRRRHLLPLLFITAGLTVPGCSDAGDGLPREAVNGTVTLDGQPLVEGTIQFAPADPTKNGVGGGAAIKSGHFSIAREYGLVPGSYNVSISAPDRGGGAGKPQAPGAGGRSALAKELIPAEYNAKSTLKVEITKGGPNTPAFTLATKKTK